MSKSPTVLKDMTLNTTLASISHSICLNEENLSAGITDGLVILAVYLEDAIHIINDLGQALDLRAT